MRKYDIPKTRHVCPKCGKKTAYKERKGGGFEGNFYWITRCLSWGYNQEKDNIENKIKGCLTNFFIIILIITFILQRCDR